MPELLHRDLSNAIFTTRIDNIDTLQKLKKCVKGGISCLVILLRLRFLVLTRWQSRAVFDPPLSEEARSRFAHLLVAITQTPAEKLLAMCQTQMSEIAERRQ